MKKGVIAPVHAGRNKFKESRNYSKKMIKEPKDIKEMDIYSKKCCYEVNDELFKIVETSLKEFCIGNNIDLQGINKCYCKI